MGRKRKRVQDKSLLNTHQNLSSKPPKQSDTNKRTAHEKRTKKICVNHIQGKPLIFFKGYHSTGGFRKVDLWNCFGGFGIVSAMVSTGTVSRTSGIVSAMVSIVSTMVSMMVGVVSICDLLLPREGRVTAHTVKNDCGGSYEKKDQDAL